RRVSDLLSRNATAQYRRRFRVSPVEWQALALVGEFGPLSLNDLAAHAILDKSQLSRAVSALVNRKLVHRGRDESDGRGISLRLTPAGQRLNDELNAVAVARNTALLGALNASERAVLPDILGKLSAEARRQIDHERAETPRTASPDGRAA